MVELAELIHSRLAAAVVGDVPVLARDLAPLPAVGRAELVDHLPHRSGRGEVDGVAETVVAGARPCSQVPLARLVQLPEVLLLGVGPVGAAGTDRREPDAELLPALPAKSEPVRRGLLGELSAGDICELGVGVSAVLTHTNLLRSARGGRTVRTTRDLRCVVGSFVLSHRLRLSNGRGARARAGRGSARTGLTSLRRRCTVGTPQQPPEESRCPTEQPCASAIGATRSG